jgi:hypothetical protein
MWQAAKVPVARCLPFPRGGRRATDGIAASMARYEEFESSVGTTLLDTLQPGASCKWSSIVGNHCHETRWRAAAILHAPEAEGIGAR